MAIPTETKLPNAPAPTDPAMALLKLLADPATLAARIQEYTDAKAAADASVALVGDANKIVDLKAQAQADRAAAAADRQTALDVKSQAQAASAQIQADAQTYAAGLKKMSDSDRAAAMAMVKTANDQAAAILAAAQKSRDEILGDATSKQSAANDSLTRAISREKAAADAQANADAARLKYEAKLKRLQAAAADG